jgi:hypothetical protein
VREDIMRRAVSVRALLSPSPRPHPPSHAPAALHCALSARWWRRRDQAAATYSRNIYKAKGSVVWRRPGPLTRQEASPTHTVLTSGRRAFVVSSLPISLLSVAEDSRELTCTAAAFLHAIFILTGTSLCYSILQISRKNLVAMGTMLGRFTHSGKFKLTVHALPVIAQHAKFKVWVKPSAEMSFLYGNHVLKSGLGRITENTPAYQVCFPSKPSGAPG